MVIISLKTCVWAKYTIDFRQDIIQVNLDQTRPQITISAIQNTNQGYEAYANQENTIVIQLKISEKIKQIEGINQDKIIIKVGNTSVIPTRFKIEKLEGNMQKIILQGIPGDGKLTINVKKGAICDLVGWENEETNLFSGIYIDNSPPKVTFAKDTGAEGEGIGIVFVEEWIRPLEGWECSEDKRTWKKVFGKEEVEFPIVTDFAGNKSGQEVRIE